jgi:hypothetical protein
LIVVPQEDLYRMILMWQNNGAGTTTFITTIWTAKTTMITGQVILCQNSVSKHSHRSIRTKVCWSLRTTTRILMLLITDSDMGVETGRLKTKSQNTSTFQKTQWGQVKSASQTTCILLESNTLSVMKQLWLSGTLFLSVWVYYTGKWMTFGRVRLGQVSSTAADGNQLNIQREEFSHQSQSV